MGTWFVLGDVEKVGAFPARFPFRGGKDKVVDKVVFSSRQRRS
jgi:hypothetical protein